MKVKVGARRRVLCGIICYVDVWVILVKFSHSEPQGPYDGFNNKNLRELGWNSNEINESESAT
jgi:hypothetical protein